MGKVLRKRKKRRPCIEEKTLVDREELVHRVKQHANGKFIEYRASQAGCVSAILGKVQQTPLEHVIENYEYVLKHLYSVRPESCRGDYVLSMHMNGARSPGSVPLDLKKVLRSVEGEDASKDRDGDASASSRRDERAAMA